MSLHSIARVTFAIFKKSWFTESSLTRDTDGRMPFVALSYRYSDSLQFAKEVYRCTGTLLPPGPLKQVMSLPITDAVYCFSWNFVVLLP
jgi:hypothetical protein